ncbi:MAG: EamA family transporter [Chloroflexota bacterium]
MIAVLLGLLAAVTNGAQAVINKGLTGRYPARQLIGALYVTNCLILLPFAPFVEWRWSPEIVALHLVSVALMVVTAIAVWDLFDAGAASSTTTASALSPIVTAVAAALILPGTFTPGQAVAAAVVSGGVLWALQGAFGGMGRRGVLIRVLVTAAGNGLLTITTRMLADLDVGVVETYVVRTALAGAVSIALFPPRDIPLRATPRLLFRSLLTTLSFVFIIVGVQQGSPVVVQTLVATTPLFALGIEAWRTRSAPPRRAVAAALLVVGGVAIVLAG